jgi:hypothetical protein
MSDKGLRMDAETGILNLEFAVRNRHSLSRFPDDPLRHVHQSGFRRHPWEMVQTAKGLVRIACEPAQHIFHAAGVAKDGKQLVGGRRRSAALRGY